MVNQRRRDTGRAGRDALGDIGQQKGFAARNEDLDDAETGSFARDLAESLESERPASRARR